MAKYIELSPHVRYILEEKPGLRESRDANPRENKGEILVYSDVDIDAFPTWLGGTEENFADERVGLEGDKDIPVNESDPPPWRSILGSYRYMEILAQTLDREIKGEETFASRDAQETQEAADRFSIGRQLCCREQRIRSARYTIIDKIFAATEEYYN